MKNLRKKYPKFIYEKYSSRIVKNNLEIFFDFRIEPDIRFKPKVIIKNVNKPRIKKIGDGALNNLIFHLGLIEMISYWKATCSPEIIIKAGYLNKKQIKWWQDLIVKGMGQFFYENKIPFQKPCFVCSSEQNEGLKKDKVSLSLKNRYLVPIGGGKDSIITLELLKKAKKDIKCFSLNPTEAAKKVIKIGECGNPIIVKRKIDKKLLELNQKGFLNGHTPFSAYLAFLSVLSANIFDYKYIAFSNEKSASEGNVKYLGKIINHQWSKSLEFEKKFQNYSKKYLNKNIEYFSFLRKYPELKIAEIFAKYPKYFSAFLSCNEAYKTASGTKKPFKKWCGKCPKCLFIYVTLYPFLEKKQLLKIFGQDLFNKKELLLIMKSLIGQGRFKPFECVGTYKENRLAFDLSLKKAKKFGKIPYLLRYFEKNEIR